MIFNSSIDHEQVSKNSFSLIGLVINDIFSWSFPNKTSIKKPLGGIKEMLSKSLGLKNSFQKNLKIDLIVIFFKSLFIKFLCLISILCTRTFGVL